MDAILALHDRAFISPQSDMISVEFLQTTN